MVAGNTPTSEGARVSLKRDIGWYGSFAMGYADVGADIYVALGLVAAYAAGWAPFAFLIAAITYVATGLAYAELATAYPYAGGAQVYSMKAFNDFAGFLAGWLVMLDYTVCIALFSIATAGYLTFFIPWLADLTVVLGVLGFQIELSVMGLASFLLVVFLIGVNIIGIKESSGLNITMVTLNLVVLTAIMVIGLLIAFNLDLFTAQLAIRGSPNQWPHIAYLWSGGISDQNFLYAVTLAMSSFIGIESIAQAAEETKKPHRTIPRATKMSIVAVLVFAVGLSAISIGIMPWTLLAGNTEAPVSALAQAIPVIGSYLVPFVAVTGFAICLVSSNTGIIGVSRVVFSMSHFGLVPEWFSKVNTVTRTPVRAIVTFGLIGAIMALIGNLDWVADLYNFGALLSYMMVNLSLIVLRHTDSETHRSWEVPFSIHITYRSQKFTVPLPSLVGVIACASIWTLVVLFHPVGRLLGLTWTGIGVSVYGLYRRRRGKPFFSKEGGRTIRPLAFKMNALVLVRAERTEEIVESLVKNIDKRFRLMLLHIVRTDDWQTPLSSADQEKHEAEAALHEMVRSLSAAGYETDHRVQVGPLNRTIIESVTSSDCDFVILPRRSAFKKGSKKDSEDDIVQLISSVAPGKLMVVRK